MSLCAALCGTLSGSGKRDTASAWAETASTADTARRKRDVPETAHPARAVRNRQRLREKKGIRRVRLNRWRYLEIGILQFLKARPVKGYLLLDGTKKVEFNHIYFISAHIHPYEGGGFKFAPDADPCDGKLTVRVIHQDNKLRLVPILLGALRGSRKNYRGSRLYHCQEAEIHVERPMPVHMDGEGCMKQQEIQLRCIPQKVRMIG